MKQPTPQPPCLRPLRVKPPRPASDARAMTRAAVRGPGVVHPERLTTLFRVMLYAWARGDQARVTAVLAVLTDGRSLRHAAAQTQALYGVRWNAKQVQRLVRDFEATALATADALGLQPTQLVDTAPADAVSPADTLNP